MKYKVNTNGLKFEKDSIIDSSDLDILSEQILLKNGSISIHEEPKNKEVKEVKEVKVSKDSKESEIKPA